MARRWSKRLLLANSHSFGRSALDDGTWSLVTLTEAPADVLVIFRGDDDVTHFFFLFFSVSITVEKPASVA